MVFNKDIVAPINVAELIQDSGQKCGQKIFFPDKMRIHKVQFSNNKEQPVCPHRK